MTSAASTAPTSQDIAVKSLTKSLENRFSLNGVADDVLAAVGERAAAEKPVVARVLTAVTEVIVSRGETVTYPTLLSGLIATLEAKDAIDKAQVIIHNDHVHGIADDGSCCRSVRPCATVWSSWHRASRGQCSLCGHLG